MKFQTILLVFFGLFALVGVIVFAGIRGGGGPDALGPVVIWGTLPQEEVERTLEFAREDDERLEDVSYIQVPEAEFTTSFTEALAVNRAPDLVLMPHEFLRSQEEKLRIIPFETFSRRNYLDTFVSAGDVYLVPTGSFGFPILVDPIVMFYNRDLLNAARITTPPSVWEQFFGYASRVSKINADFTLDQSFVAMGTYNTITYARQLLSTLFIQAGTPIVSDASGEVRSVLAQTGSSGQQPAAAGALRFYTEFADPLKDAYSWSDGMGTDREAFLNGDLALYFAPASEGKRLAAANPLLDFDVARVPQPETANTSVTYATVYALSVPRLAPNPEGALEAAFALVNIDNAQFLADVVDTAPARRDLLVEQDDPFLEVYYQSALIGQPWLSPQPREIDAVFSAMVDNVIRGGLSAAEALRQASAALQERI